VKNIKTFLLSLIFVFAATAIAFAGAVPSALPVAAKAQQITGEVKAISAGAMSINVAKRCGNKVVESVITIGKGTKILKDNKEKKFTDIKTGDKVVAKYTKVGAKNIAESISLQQPAEPEGKEPGTK
jgi:ribosomal protein S1